MRTGTSWSNSFRLAAAASCVLAACAATPMRDPRIDALMRDYSGDVPGTSVLVLRDGRIVHRAGYGLADLEAHVPVTPQTNFRLASMSKQFTAAAIEILARRGTLSYDDPITRFLPTLPAYARNITIRQLLTHSSGLLDYEDLIADDRNSWPLAVGRLPPLLGQQPTA